ncbi:heme oxygenase-like protein [Leucogyrophana mollusca]|uniref:Heme oxygenase-like protein n=1 Tax=Leucogyrophana mollusca TaxID=85980 RepID=A0ACB8BSC2_9AGAM|nr:heme oxygenase-like protein [Leucogyrophana mollusca]
MCSDALHDLTLPMASLLRTGTSVAHREVERSQGGIWLTKGELDKAEYVRYLMMLWHIYNTLESGLSRHASHPILQPTSNPALLARTPGLASDISFLLQVPESSWQSHPAHVALTKSPPPALLDYSSRIHRISESDPPRLLAHAYVRYLGDMSGGQILRRRIAKAYGLDIAEGSGIQFYHFSAFRGGKSGTGDNIRKMKDWYREGMNSAVGNDANLKAAILDEAILAFELNSALLATLRGTTRACVDREGTSCKDAYQKHFR